MQPDSQPKIHITRPRDCRRPVGATTALGFGSAKGEAGNILFSTDPDGAAGRWSVAVTERASSPAAATVNSIACPSTTLYVAVDNGATYSPVPIRPGASGAWSIAAIDQGGD